MSRLGYFIYKLLRAQAALIAQYAYTMPPTIASTAPIGSLLSPYGA